MLLQEVALTKLAAQYELRKAKSASITLGSGTEPSRWVEYF